MMKYPLLKRQTLNVNDAITNRRRAINCKTSVKLWEIDSEANNHIKNNKAPIGAAVINQDLEKMIGRLCAKPHRANSQK
jgi:hypothetical protein